MLQILQRGHYRLYQTTNGSKILILDDERMFSWSGTGGKGSLKQRKTAPGLKHEFLSSGSYRVYNVEHEKNLTDGIHLELHVDERIWQPYLLPSGFPKDDKDAVMQATDELITASS